MLAKLLHSVTRVLQAFLGSNGVVAVDHGGLRLCRSGKAALAKRACAKELGQIQRMDAQNEDSFHNRRSCEDLQSESADDYSLF